MHVRYYDYFGRPARMVFDGEYPDHCECFNPGTGRLERNGAAEVDLIEGIGQTAEITEEQFNAMLAKAMAARNG